MKASAAAERNEKKRGQLREGTRAAAMEMAQEQRQAVEEKKEEEMAFETRLLHPRAKAIADPYAAMSPPLYQTATFAQPSATEMGEYDYTRSGNPTRAQFESLMSELEGGCDSGGFAFTSGMAAITAACRLVSAGGSMLAGDDGYGGTSRLLDAVLPGYGVSVTHVDMCDIESVRAALEAGNGEIGLVLLESPTNPRMNVTDIRSISEMAHKHGALVLMDNSILAPVFQRPLDLGADISMTSTTKFIGGHSDTTGGTLTVKDPELAKRIYFIQNSEGSGLAPFDCWLCLRGIKTMALRMERQAENTLAIARFLQSHPMVTGINYAGLESDAGYELNRSQATSAGSLLSFTTGDAEVSNAIVAASKLFKVTVSFGGCVSLMSMPCYMSHASIPKEVREARGLPDDLIRISAGIENIDDLIKDLSTALDAGAALKAAKQ